MLNTAVVEVSRNFEMEIETDRASLVDKYVTRWGLEFPASINLCWLYEHGATLNDLQKFAKICDEYLTNVPPNDDYSFGL